MKKCQKSVELFGTTVHDISIGDAIAACRQRLTADGASLSGKNNARAHALLVFTPNLSMISGAYRSRGTQRLLNRADISLPDGFGLKIVAALLGKRLENTAPGIDFGEELLRFAAGEGIPTFLLGAEDGVADEARKNLTPHCRGLRICGTHHGYFSQDEESAVLQKIKESAARILIVCRGFPRQEKFALKAASCLPQLAVCACLGGSLDVWSGRVERAPLPVRWAHLEWLWRILAEPRRLGDFLVSLDVLAAALCVRARKILEPLRITPHRAAYNQINEKQGNP